jgi:hypothetical protein
MWTTLLIFLEVLSWKIQVGNRKLKHSATTMIFAKNQR